MEHKVHTAIIGSGITGLCTAHSLSKHSETFHIFEKAQKIGGAIQSISQQGYLAETGPNSLLIKDLRVAQLLDSLELSEKGALKNEWLPAKQEAKKRFIVRNGQLIELTSHPLSLLKSPLFSTKGKLRLLYEPFVKKHQGESESFADFVTRRFGRELLERAAEPFVSGIYAGDPTQLSVQHAFPRMHDLEQKYGSIIRGFLAMQRQKHKNSHTHPQSTIASFKSGMHKLPETVAKQLPEGTLQLESCIKTITPRTNGWSLSWLDKSGEEHEGLYKNLVISTPHHQLAKLPLPVDLKYKLSAVAQLHAPPVTSLTLGFKRQDITHPLDGFGMLITQAEKSPLLGVIFSSSMFSHRAPEGHVTLTCMMGGSLHPEYAENEEQTVLKELNRLLGVNGKPTFRHRTEWAQAIPQYNLGYQNVIDAITNCQQEYPNLHFAANYYQGISVGDCIINGLELGDSLASSNLLAKTPKQS